MIKSLALAEQGQAPELDLRNYGYNLTTKILESLDASQSTIKDYKSRFEHFYTFLRKDGLNEQSLLAYKKYLAGLRFYSVSTKNKQLTVARIFMKQLYALGYLKRDMPRIKGFKQSKKHKRVGPNDQEMQLIIDWLGRLPIEPSNSRLVAIVSLLAIQGLRQIEIVRLDLDDLDLPRGITYVRGKGQDDKEPIYLHPNTVRSLEQYLEFNKAADGPLFTSFSNNSKDSRLSTRTIRNLIKAVFSEIGINSTTHGFRHFYTTKLIKVYKGDLIEIAKFTRHKSLEMLQVYNDNVQLEHSLPRYYQAFNEVQFGSKQASTSDNSNYRNQKLLTVFSIGHSNLPKEQLVLRLKSYGIDNVVDVRTKPYSRFSPQYNKEPLSEYLNLNGIGYEFRGKNPGGLGENIEYLPALEEIKHRSRDERIALLCSEKDFKKCHRQSVIAPDLNQIGVSVTHIP